MKLLTDSAIVELYWDRDEEAIAASDAKYGACCRGIACNILDDR
jgi:RNA polymerase sigma-70 factor (ECF subfamily)